MLAVVISGYQGKLTVIKLSNNLPDDPSDFFFFRPGLMCRVTYMLGDPMQWLSFIS